MDIADVRLKTDDELKKQVTELYKEEMNLRFQQANGQLNNTAQKRLLRRDIARIQTVLSERRHGISYANDDAKPAKAKAKKAAAPKKEEKAKAAPKKAAKAKDEKPAKKTAAKKKA
ncbi:MAG: 50S ribosomal protein L29 [Alphaproteobacteria bacterium]|nr:MAG: 50S ribosomal protein L29 [Alphaproteobacteria bacterium]